METRYTIEVLTAPSGHGYMAKVKDGELENGGYAWQAERPRPTEVEAAELGQAWIDATEKRDAEVARLKEERARELPGQITEIRLRVAAHESEKSDINTKIKQLVVDEATLIRDAHNPQVPFEFSEPFPEQQGLPGTDEDDDPPVADANGHHPDGPDPEGTTKKRRRKRTPPNRADGKGARVPHDDDAPLPDWSEKDGIVKLRAAALARGLILDDNDHPKKPELLKRLQAWVPRPGLDPSKVDWFGDGEGEGAQP